MRIPIPSVIRRHPILSLALALAITGYCAIMRKQLKTEDHLPVTVRAIQHLGVDYRIESFYINKYTGGSIREGGEGGGITCCISLPIKWSPGLKADVRWEVHHIISTNNPSTPETAEIEGIYQAQVPVEPYVKPDSFWVHFLPKGKVRIIVNQTDSNEDQDEIYVDSVRVSQKATTGAISKSLFTPEELAASERETARNREKFGDWR